MYGELGVFSRVTCMYIKDGMSVGGIIERAPLAIHVGVGHQ